MDREKLAGVLARGLSAADAAKELGVSIPTYYRWRRMYLAEQEKSNPEATGVNPPNAEIPPAPAGETPPAAPETGERIDEPSAEVLEKAAGIESAAQTPEPHEPEQEYVSGDTIITYYAFARASAARVLCARMGIDYKDEYGQVPPMVELILRGARIPVSIAAKVQSIAGHWAVAGAVVAVDMAMLFTKIKSMKKEERPATKETPSAPGAPVTGPIVQDVPQG